MRVLKTRGGSVYHVVNETLTKFRKATGFILCKYGQEVDVAEMRAGVATCRSCKILDNVVALNAHERGIIARAAHGVRPQKQPGLGKLIAIDIIEEETMALTRRGQLLALDYTEGAAPWCDADGVWHARTTLSADRVCGGVIQDLDGLGVEKYNALRAVARPVSCVPCMCWVSRG